MHFNMLKKIFIVIRSFVLFKISNLRAGRTRHFFSKSFQEKFFFINTNRLSPVAIKSVRWSPQVLVVFIWNHPTGFIMMANFASIKERPIITQLQFNLNTFFLYRVKPVHSSYDITVLTYEAYHAMDSSFACDSNISQTCQFLLDAESGDWCLQHRLLQ